MALARGILIWLPPDKLLQLYRTLSEDLVRERLALVNQISETEARELAAQLDLPFATRHLWLSALQGELHPDAEKYIPLGFLMGRAIFLGSATQYRKYAGRSGGPYYLTNLEAQLVYQNGQPELVAAALAALDGLPLRVYDPASVSWNDSLRLVTVAYLLRRKDWRGEEVALAGYLEAKPLEQVPRHQLVTYINWLIPSRWRRQIRFTEGEIRIIREAAGRDGVNGWFASLGSADFPDPISAETASTITGMALRSLRPETVIASEIKPFAMEVDRVIPALPSRDLVRRAGGILALSREMDWLGKWTYFEVLPILLGQRFHVGLLTEAQRKYLFQVAHPDLRLSDFPTNGSVPSSSAVCYDLKHMLSLLPDELGPEEPDRASVYLWGRLLDLRRWPSYLKEVLLDRTPEPDKSSWSTEFGRRYNEYLAILTGKGPGLGGKRSGNVCTIF